MTLLTILGILAIIAGALIIAYNGFVYSKNQKIAQVGDVKLRAPKYVYLSPTAGTILIGAGIVILYIASRF